MTGSTITPIAGAASEAVDALAASAFGRVAGASRDDAPFAFDRVLADEADASVSSARTQPQDRAADPDGREPRRTGRPASPSAIDPQPDHGRDDEHAVGRTRSRRGREAAEPRPADDAGSGTGADDAKVAAEAPMADASTPDRVGGSTGGVTTPGETAATDETETGAGVGTAAAAGGATGKGNRKPSATTETLDGADGSVLVAAVTPAIAAGQPAAAARPEGSAPDRQASRNAAAATPAIAATPAVAAHAAADGVVDPAASTSLAVSATPAVPAAPAHRSPAPATGLPPAADEPAPSGTADIGASAPAAAPSGATATPSATDDAVALGAARDPLAATTASVAVSGAQRDAAAGSASAVRAETASVSASNAATTGPVAVGPARRESRTRGIATAARSGDVAGRESPSAGRDLDLPATASDVARARASMARIVAATPDDGVTARRHDDGSAAAAQGAVPAAALVGNTPAADAALAAIAGARQGTPVAASPSATVAAPASAPAADRLAFEAIDRIRTTVTAGVPGLESRIDDPTLGTIRIVVSARLGETIRAEIIARDPAAARELASGIDRALAAGAALPANVDLRVRAEGAAPSARSDGHLGQGAGEHARSQDQAASGGPFSGRGDGPAGHGAHSGFGHGADHLAPVPATALAPAHGRIRAVGPAPVSLPSTPGAPPAGTALDVRA